MWGFVFYKGGEQDPKNDLLSEGDGHQVPQVGYCYFHEITLPSCGACADRKAGRGQAGLY